MAEAETLERRADGSLPPVPLARPSPRQLTLARPVTRGERFHNLVASRRLFILVPFALIAGLIVYVQLPVEPQRWALGGVGIVTSALVAVTWRTDWRALANIVFAFWIGLCLLPFHGALFGTAMLSFPAYGVFTAQVDEVLSATAEEQRVVVSHLARDGDRPQLPLRRARVLLPGEPSLAPGDLITAELRLTPVPGPVLPGTFDGQFHSYFAGIGAYGSVIGDFRRVGEGAPSITRNIEALRAAIGQRIDAVLNGDSAAIGRAMVMGDQSAITDETRDVMAASGLAHIYSISGLHLSLVAGGVFWLIRLGLASIAPVALRWPIKQTAAVFGIVASAGYLMLAGGPANIPALRSTIMLILVFGAVLAGRRALTMRNVAFAALAIVILDPATVFRPSFQLSFAAVVGLIGIYELPRAQAERSRSVLGRLFNAVWVTALTSLVAGVATLLFSAYHFQQTAPLGVIGNVLVLPIVSFVIMPAALLSVLLMPLGVEHPVVLVMGWGIDRMVDGAVLVAGWSEGWIGNPLLTGSSLVLGLAALAWFAVVPGRWRLAGPAALIPLVLLFGLDQRPDVVIADTTQALAVRTDDGLGLVTGKTGSFAVEVWGQHYQEPIAAKAPGSRCDSLACVLATPRYTLAVVRAADAFADECGRHDLLVTRIRAPSWCSGTVIDEDDLATGGAQWLRWNEAAGSFDIRPAIPNVTRPWRAEQW